jgi:DNA-binding IclR family transcriptional regulator
MVGMSGLAVPVFTHDGKIAFALTAFGHSATFDTSIDGPIATAVRAKAAELSKRLGYRAV